MRFINQQTSLGGNILYSKVIIGLYRDNTSWLVVEPYPSEKYESQMGLLFPIYGTI